MIQHLSDIGQLPDDTTILLVSTDVSENNDKAILIKQLNEYNIPYVNAYDILSDIPRFNMIEKPFFIMQALKNITTKYVIICDAYDVLFNSFNHIIDNFKEYNCDVLFNACKAPFPGKTIEHIKDRDGMEPYMHLNAGFIVGYRDSLMTLYQKCVFFIESDEYDLNNTSEQYIVRNAIAKDTPYIDFTDFSKHAKYRYDYKQTVCFNTYDRIA